MGVGSKVLCLPGAGVPAPQGAPGGRAQPTPLLGHRGGSTWNGPLHTCARRCGAFPWKVMYVLLSLVPGVNQALKENVPALCPSVRLVCAFERSASHLSSRATLSAQAVHRGKCFMEIIHSAFLGVTPELPAWCSQRERSFRELIVTETAKWELEQAKAACTQLFVAWLSSLKACWRLENVASQPNKLPT